MKQIKYKDIENDVICGGIRLDDGDIICACCGSLIPVDEQDAEYGFELLEEYDNWVDFSNEIIDN